MRYSNINKLYLETEIINGEILFKRFSLLGKVGEIDFVNKKKKSYYANENLEFECGYINNTKHGKAKEYYLTGELEFEGEYLYGLKWNGKKYDKNGNIIYELNNGNGKVKEYEGEKLIFEGEYINGKRNGKGKEYENGTLKFEGEYLNGYKCGKGKEYNNNGTL